MSLVFSEHPGGVETEPGNRVVYDPRARATRTSVLRHVDGHALVWELTEDPGPGGRGIRCDRVDFPPGGAAYRHVHPGPGIRRLLFGELTIESPEQVRTPTALESGTLEGADHPVLATASTTEDTAFVRVLLLPAEWAGKRTIRYLDPADAEKPKLQRATIFLEQLVQRAELRQRGPPRCARSTRVDGLPEPLSHYADAVRAGDLLFVSGIVPVDAEGPAAWAEIRRCRAGDPAPSRTSGWCSPPPKQRPETSSR